MSSTLIPPRPRPPAPEPAPPAAAAKPWYKREFYVGRAVKPEEVMNFSRQLASFLRAGVPILDSLEVVSEENASKKMQEVVGDMQRRLRAGSSFGDAIGAQHKVFPGYYIAVVHAAELTGHLDDSLEELAGYMEREVAVQRELKSALTYPAIVLVLAIVAVSILSAYVLPKFKDFYKSLDANLPLPTRMLLGFTDFMGNWWPVILGAVVALVLAGVALLGGKRGKIRRDALLLRLPGVSGLVHLAAIERFCRVLAALVHTGVPLPDAVQVAADSTNNRVFQAKLGAAREAMMRGEGLARPITATGIFPPAARQMIRVGESTGSLDTQLHNAAIFYERELSFRIKRFTDMFEPAIIVSVGGMVAFVAIAQISAMYSIYNQVKI
jgi:type IV pilus assembly protein PilC